MANHGNEEKYLRNCKVTIVGFGLMGGSLALSLRSYVSEITAVDINMAIVKQALELGLAKSATNELSLGIADADIVVLAIPVKAIIRTLAELPDLRPDGCMVIDLGSTKRRIVEVMSGLPAQFSAIGGHPMCGRETSGLNAAEIGLYKDQTFILCRNKRTTPSIERLALDLVYAIKARPTFLTPEAHDAIVATTSHIPYLMASSLLSCVAADATVDEQVWKVSASGLRDTTRLAGSNPEMMADILLTNRDAILDKMRVCERNVSDLIALLESGDEINIRNWLNSVRRSYIQYRSIR